MAMEIELVSSETGELIDIVVLDDETEQMLISQALALGTTLEDLLQRALYQLMDGDDDDL